jgi:hypothetical protein
MNSDKETIPAIRNMVKLIRLPTSTCNFRVRSTEGLRLLGAYRVSVRILRTKKPVIQDISQANRKNPTMVSNVVAPGKENES